MALEERMSRMEGEFVHLATKEDMARLEVSLKGEISRLEVSSKADIAELRGELRGMRWIMTAVGVGLAALTVILKFLG